ncbi:MAG: hypothetical protein NTY83_00685 [Candidatus Micrarchaeota archaeon]|nr:hypothetical protein [Candidatus Micrarchaeota archaeon]
MQRRTEVGFIDEKARDAFIALKDGKAEEKELYGTLNHAFDELKKNPHCGIMLQKRLWPKEYVKRYGITNLWKYNLPDGWRLIYMIRLEEVSIVSVVLEWFNHTNYERRFGY